MRTTDRAHRRRFSRVAAVAAVTVSAVLLSSCATVIEGTAARAGSVAATDSSACTVDESAGCSMPLESSRGSASAPDSSTDADATGSGPATDTSAGTPDASSGTASTTDASATDGSAGTADGSVHGASIATVDGHGIITVRAADADGSVVLDLYEDPLCPICAQFEAAFGEDIGQAIDDGDLTVRYRIVTFLDPESASGDYSTRAFAALLTLAKTAGDEPGLVVAFHSALFDPTVQPQERGSDDLSDADLADLAGELGAPADAVAAIADGTEHATARQAAADNLDELGRVSPQPGTPTAVSDGSVVDIRSDGWLDRLIEG